MRYGLFKGSSGYDSSLALAAIMPASGALVACSPCFEAGMPGAVIWTDVYMMAYEQARAALEPSRFQNLLKPSWN